MPEALRRLLDRPWILVGGAGVLLLWNILAVAGRIRTIRRRGGSVLARVPEGALFVEKWTSGNSDRHLLSRIGGAGSCLLVALTPERFVVRPHFPFNLVPGTDLDHHVPLGEVESVEAHRGGVKVGIPGRLLDLRLRHPQGLLAAWAILESRRRRSP